MAFKGYTQRHRSGPIHRPHVISYIVCSTCVSVLRRFRDINTYLANVTAYDLKQFFNSITMLQIIVKHGGKRIVINIMLILRDIVSKMFKIAEMTFKVTQEHW